MRQETPAGEASRRRMLAEALSGRYRPLMPARLRKFIGSVAILLWVVFYAAVAAAIGDKLKGSPWWVMLIYFPLAGLLWIAPLRPLFKWLHAKDGPTQSPDV
jgi:hypothetical protein